MLWLDSTPQHGARFGSLNGGGTWRNQIARAVWARFAPSVTIVHLEELLHDRNASKHPGEETHWCPDTRVFEELISVVLSAVLNVLMRAVPSHAHAQAEGQDPLKPLATT